MAILQNRKQNPTSTTPYRWQNLKHDNCPIDGEMLRDKIGKYEVLECSNGDCSFHIRFDRMREILADINHPANKFALTV